MSGLFWTQGGISNSFIFIVWWNYSSLFLGVRRFTQFFKELRLSIFKSCWSFWREWKVVEIKLAYCCSVFLNTWLCFFPWSLKINKKKKSAVDLSFTCSILFPAKPGLIYPGKVMNTGIIISIYNLMLHRCVLICSSKVLSYQLYYLSSIIRRGLGDWVMQNTVC